MKRSAVSNGCVDKDKYHTQIGQCLGSGYTATVHAAKDGRGEFAVKTVTKENQNLIACTDYYREIYGRLLNSRNPNLVNIFEVVEDADHFYISMDRCYGSDLVEFALSLEPGTMPESECKRIMFQLLSGLNHLHSKKRMLHRDVKLDNIMFLDSSNQQIVLIDFDMCMLTDRIETPTKLNEVEVSVVGTKEYMAPECYHGNYSMASDLWSCGVILFVLLDGHFPFDVTSCTSNREIRRLLQRGYYVHTSVKTRCPLAVQLLMQLLHFNAADRLQTAADALSSSWFWPVPRLYLGHSKMTSEEASTADIISGETISPSATEYSYEYSSQLSFTCASGRSEFFYEGPDVLLLHAMDSINYGEGPYNIPFMDSIQETYPPFAKMGLWVSEETLGSSYPIWTQCNKGYKQNYSMRGVPPPCIPQRLEAKYQSKRVPGNLGMCS